MKSKFIKALISTLVATLIALTSFIGYKTYCNVKYINSVKAQQTQQIKTNKQIENWNYKLNNFKNEYSKSNKLLTLQGKVTIENTFTDDDKIVKYQGNDNTIKFLLGKLNTLKIRSMTVNTEYKYGFTYSTEYIEANCDNNGNLTIHINKQFLNLEYLDGQTDKTIIDTKTHLLSGKFTSQEQAGIMNVTKIRTWNTLVNNNDLKEKGIQSTKEVLNDLAKKFGFKQVKIIIDNTYNTINNNEVEIKNITYNK